MKNSTASLAIIGILLAASTTLAEDQLQNTTERVQDHRQIRQDNRALADDLADLNRFSDLVMKWDAARQSGNNTEIQRLQLQIAAALRSDLKENAVQVAQAQKEVNQSKQELRSERRDVREERRDVVQADAYGTPAQEAEERHELRSDRRDRRDDRRDVRDDQKDRNAAAALAQQKKDIALELGALQSQIDSGSGDVNELQNQQETLLNRYVTLSKKEVEMGAREKREDKRELREDRRETRQDRRQG